jgi:tRNA (mo5U34)-methyltransferase
VHFAGTLVRVVLKALSRLRHRRARADLPLKGFGSGRIDIPRVERLGDDDLARLNSLLDWRCFVVDRQGRRFGNLAWEGKRSDPQVVPDRRVLLADERFDLADKHVLEVGCFEGIHTVALCERAASVTAIDARIENVVKTIVRCAFFGCHPAVLKCNVEERPLELDRLRADVVYHVGVLYHLQDPVRHLRDLAEVARAGLLLDTHYAEEGQATETYEVDGEPYRYYRFREGGDADCFSGVYAHSRWLLLEDIVRTLGKAGFEPVDIVERRSERNGPRALLLAGRKARRQG